MVVPVKDVLLHHQILICTNLPFHAHLILFVWITKNTGGNKKIALGLLDHNISNKMLNRCDSFWNSSESLESFKIPRVLNIAYVWMLPSDLKKQTVQSVQSQASLLRCIGSQAIPGSECQPILFPYRVCSVWACLSLRLRLVPANRRRKSQGT